MISHMRLVLLADMIIHMIMVGHTVITTIIMTIMHIVIINIRSRIISKLIWKKMGVLILMTKMIIVLMKQVNLI